MFLKNTLILLTCGFLSLQAQAQLFETRSTFFALDKITHKFDSLATEQQREIQAAILEKYSPDLAPNESLETYFDDYHLGMVVYQFGKPYTLIGFWDPAGNEIKGGTLNKGNGTVLTPFNPRLVNNFESESVVYKSGLKNGPVFYYCDCASVLRKGNFVDNQKEGLWLEFTPSGEFIKQKRIVLPTLKDDKVEKDPDWLKQAHCMMRNPDEIIKCPTDL